MQLLDLLMRFLFPPKRAQLRVLSLRDIPRDELKLRVVTTE
jgi:hypothetical protein